MSFLLLVGLAMLAWAVGFLAFHAAPILEKATRNDAKRIGRLHCWLAMFAIRRAALVVQEDGQLLWKKLAYDELGLAAVSLGDRKKLFEDPDDAISTFCGMPFLLLDEPHGVGFDPRHALIGMKKEAARKRGELVVRATDEEAREWGHYGWIRAVFELPNEYVMTKLEGVRHIVSGNERGVDSDYAVQFYKNSINPDGVRTPLLRLLVPPMVFIGILIAFWQISTRMNGGGGGGGGGTTVPFALLTVSLPGVHDWLEKHRQTVASVGIAGLVLVGLAVLAGPLITIVLVIAFMMGFFAIPALAMGLGLIGAGGAISKILIWFGLLAFEEPVLLWTPQGYRLREQRELSEEVETVATYRIGSSRVAFAVPPGSEAFGAEIVDADVLDSEMQTEATPDSNLPASAAPVPTMRSGGFAGYVPKRLDSAGTYIHSAIAAARFRHAATGRVVNRKLQEAKEKYGDGNWAMSDRTLVYATFAAMVLASFVGVIGFL